MSSGEPSETGETSAPEGSGGVAPPAVPLDSDDTRSMHLRRLLGSPITLSLGATLIIAAFIGGTVAAGVAIGGGAGAAAFLLVLLVVFVLASNAAAEDFFKAYAGARGLSLSGRGHLPPSTPLLRKGDKRYAERIMDGTLPGGFPGAIGLYTFEERSTDSEGNQSTDYYHYTVVMHDIPAAAPKVSDVYCHRRSGFRFMDSTEDVFRSMQRLELESESLDKRFEIFYGANDDENWMKQLFSPSFIVWLAEASPKTFGFELSAGSLCVYVEKHKNNASELDAICEAASKVAKRCAEEASE